MSTFEELLRGGSPNLRRVMRTAGLVAATDVTVLILGESGTGKELLARAVHLESPRANGPYVSVNCASLGPELAESSLWGHRRGSFTGAVSDHRGFVRSAAGGTLFLDEIGELSLAVQARLLRFLESSEVQPVGATGPERADVRVIAATHRDLAERVETGTFREDLYYRLNVVPLELPPLRNRTGDIEPLIEHFVGQIADEMGLAAPRFGSSALGALAGYSWPGNVRELRNLCERMVILFQGREVEEQNLPDEVRRGHVSRTVPTFRLPPRGVSLEALEADMIRQALERTSGNQSRAAQLLGLTRYALIYRMKKHAIAI